MMGYTKGVLAEGGEKKGSPSTNLPTVVEGDLETRERG